jgi:uncharacterized membrane protein YraQ (UPF0718 family)
VQKIHAGTAIPVDTAEMNWEGRFLAGWHHVKEIVGKVWPYVLAGIAVGAGILLVGFLFNIIL